ncbi:putative nuclease HARBI1 [Aphis gossypii]|uniref:putative nuclease HARBI1 n=1 Tax=Aphis gossypii TaxID=80765 RepID=UPI0021594349|nr:putative nuclease HARBI1 [Aphis gossypii]
MESYLSKCILFFGLNYLENINNSLDKKKYLLFNSLLKSSKVRITNFMLVISLYDDLDFKCHFRLTRNSVEVLMCKMKPYYIRHTNVGRPVVDFKKATLMTIWYLSNTETFRQIGDRFGLNRGHACRTIHKYLQSLSILLDDFIIWPKGISETITVQEFKNLRLNHMPNTIGCIDGCHIRIHSPKYKRSEYTNRKMFQSIVLLAVCNANLEFTYIFSGWPGSSHDARVFKNSSLGDTLLNNPQEIVTKDVHLLGDLAFPLLESLIVPYKAVHILSEKEKLFNKRLSSTRVVIEQAFGLLLGRFRRLKSLEAKSIRLMSLAVTGACILHNLVLKNNDLMEIDTNTEHLNLDHLIEETETN